MANSGRKTSRTKRKSRVGTSSTSVNQQPAVKTAVKTKADRQEVSQTQRDNKSQASVSSSTKSSAKSNEVSAKSGVENSSAKPLSSNQLKSETINKIAEKDVKSVDASSKSDSVAMVGGHGTVSESQENSATTAKISDNPQVAKIVLNAPENVVEFTKKIQELTMNKLPNYEVPSFFKEAAETTLKQSKTAYNTWKSSADEGTKALESAIGNSSKGLVDLQRKSLELLNAQVEANFAFAQSLLNSRTLEEVVEQTTSFTRKSAENAVNNSKDLQQAISQIANDASEPLKSAVEKATKNASNAA